MTSEYFIAWIEIMFIKFVIASSNVAKSAIYSYTAGETKFISKFNLSIFPLLLLLEFKEFRKFCNILSQYCTSLLAVGEFGLALKRSGRKYFSILRLINCNK